MPNILFTEPKKGLLLSFWLSLVILQASPGVASFACKQRFLDTQVNLSFELRKVSKFGSAVFRKKSRGSWVKVQDQWLRYKFYGTEGPLRVHFSGLGSEINESFLRNRSLVKYAQTGRVLMVEVLGQGLTESHARYRLEKKGKSARRAIDFSNNQELSVLAVKEILKLKNKELTEIAVWSGNSFGGMHLTGMLANKLQKTSLVQLFATVVTSYENRFLSEKGTAALEKAKNRADKLPLSPGTKIGHALTKVYLGMQKIVRKEDKVKLSGAAGQVFGFRNVDAIDLVKTMNSKTRVQLFTASNDLIIYPMTHYELTQEMAKNGIAFTAVIVDGASHNIGKSLSREQVNLVQKMSENPENYLGYYQMTNEGKLISLTELEALKVYKRRSLFNWKLQKSKLKIIFGLLGKKVSYPEEWL